MKIRPLALVPLLAVVATAALADGPLGFDRLAGLRSVGSVVVSPDGAHVAYTLSVPRRPGVDEDGPAWTELRVVATDGSSDRSFVHDRTAVADVAFAPSGDALTFLSKRGDDEHTSLWSIPLDGGEARKLFGFETAIAEYAISPDGTRLAFVARPAVDEAREKEKDKGFDREVFEEEWRPRNLYLAGLRDPDAAPPDPAATPAGDAEPVRVELDGSAFGVAWSRDGKHLLTSVAPRPLVDDEYMKRRITVVDVAQRAARTTFDTPGKLGDFRFSPDGTRVAMIAGEDSNDPAEGRLRVGEVATGELRDLLPGFDGHVSDLAWIDAGTVAYLADVGCETRFATVGLGGESAVRFESSGSASPAPIVTSLSLSRDGAVAAFSGQKPTHPAEVYVVAGDESTPRRLTDTNPWLRDVSLAPQEVWRFEARDDLALEGILIRPLDARRDAPLMMIVHGGPESHVRNGWVTSYSRPGQLAAAEGFAVFYPNYRGSTGRGVAFSKWGHGDAAGKEFDDLIDAIDALAEAGIADADRVGVTGGSYGGYATAWLSTRYTDRIAAGVMFVGISNKLSKAFTTDIPIEDQAVHTLFEPWTKWQFSLERSPLFHAEKSRTPLLIAHGEEDTRVHPSQSLQLYRALKMMDNAPVRYVRYPGEPHGNRRAASREDYARRLMRWMIHFVRDGGTDLPPYDVDYSFEIAAEADDDDESEENE